MPLDRDELPDAIPADAPPDVLRGMAQCLRRQADAIEAEAARRAEAIVRPERARAAIGQCRAAGADAFRRVCQGENLEAIAREYYVKTRIPEGTTLYWFKVARDEAAARERGQRDREMMRLAARGWANAQIGARFGVHAKTVQRAIARMRRAGQF